jgi:putative Mg2+ transporter-C (MgtC) family protein
MAPAQDVIVRPAPPRVNGRAVRAAMYATAGDIVMMETVTSPVIFSDIVVRLTLAIALGAAVGFDRELQQKPAGLRTHALVALGAALVTLVSLLITNEPEALGRVLQGIVAGVGFIGGGVILRRTETSDVMGLTTAATIWVVASIGIAVGAGMWRTALVSVVLVLLTLTLGEPVNRLLRRRKVKD